MAAKITSAVSLSDPDHSGSSTQRMWPYFILLAISIIIFHAKFDLSIIWFTHDAWLMTLGSDWAPNYLQWCHYRISPWGIPIGMIDTYSYPEPVSVGLTGAIPLMALLFKPFEAIFPLHFQYHGLYLFANYFMQLLMGYKLMQIKSSSVLINLTGSLFFLFSAAFLFRYYHVNLTCHWILLSLIYLFYRRDYSTRTRIGALLILTLISSLIQAYIVLFPLGIGLVILYQLYRENKIDLKQMIGFYVAIPIIIFSSWLALGNFSIGLSGGQGIGYGFYSANLNTLLNNQGFGRLLPSLRNATEGQYEGLGYLGAGILLGILFLLPFIFTRNTIKGALKTLRPDLMWAMALIYFLFSLSNVISINEMSWTIELPAFIERLFSRFRSSGRYVWVIHYLTIVHVLWGIARLKKRAAIGIITGLLIVQIIDLSPMLNREKWDTGTYQEKLTSSAFDPLFGAANKVITYPMYLYEYAHQRDAEDLVFMAYKHDKPITAGHLARPGDPWRWDYINRFESFLQTGQDDEFEDALIISTKDFYQDFGKIVNQGFTYYMIDEYLVIFPSHWEDQQKHLTSLELKEQPPLEREYLVNFLSRHKDHIVLITAKDEATEGLCDEAKAYLSERGSAINKLGFRGSYAAILHGDSLLWESVDNNAEIRKRFEQGDSLGDIETPIAIEIISAGNKLGPNSHVWIGPQQYSSDLRGLNIVVLDEDFKVIESVNFDTWLRCYRIL